MKNNCRYPSLKLNKELIRIEHYFILLCRCFCYFWANLEFWSPIMIWFVLWMDVNFSLNVMRHCLLNNMSHHPSIYSQKCTISLAQTSIKNWFKNVSTALSVMASKSIKNATKMRNIRGFWLGFDHLEVETEVLITWKVTHFFTEFEVTHFFTEMNKISFRQMNKTKWWSLRINIPNNYRLHNLSLSRWSSH